jgi:hypothetical protein
MKAGVIVNARATRIKRARWFLWRLMAKTSEKILWKITNEIRDIGSALDEFFSKGVEHLLICGGDGSVQKVLTEMILRFGNEWKPAILHIPGGATNVLSKNLNMQEGPVMVMRRYIKKVIEKGEEPFIHYSNVLKIEDERLKFPVYGITFTNGIAFELTRKYLELPPGMRSVMKVVYSAIAEFIASTMKGEGSKSGYFQRIPVKIIIDGNEYPYNEVLISLATILPNPLMWFRPFYNSDGIPRDGFYFLANSMENREILRNLFQLLTGRFPGTKSYNGMANEVLITTKHGYAVDGEVVPFESPTTLKITKGPVIKLISV